MRRLLGEILVSDGNITEEELNLALEKQKDDGRLIGIILIEMGYITQRELEKAIIKQKKHILDENKKNRAK